MNSEQVRKRIMRRLTTPPELLYAFTRHWLIVFVFMVVGTLGLLVKVMTDPPAYEGQASLLITASDTLLAEGTNAAREVRGRDEAQAFFNSRVDILQSDSVIRGLVEFLKPSNFLRADATAEKETPGFRNALGEIRKGFDNALSLFDSSGHDGDEPEAEVQKAIASFKSRSEVLVPDPKNNTVEIRVWGADRDRVFRELNRWVEEYINYLVDMIRKSRDIYVSSRKMYWKNVEEEAKKTLEDYKVTARDKLKTASDQNPEISQEAMNVLMQQIMDLRDARNDLQRMTDGGEPLSRQREPRTTDPERQLLLERKGGLEKELTEALAYHPETSDKVMRLKEMLQQVEKQLKGYTIEFSDPVARQKWLEDRIAKIEKQISDARDRLSVMGRELERVRNLEDDYRFARQTRQTFERMTYEEADRGDARKNLQVQISDQPHVSWEPVDRRPLLQVVLGCLGGVALGFLIGVVMELVSGKVRFKNDITGEFGLPVIGVIPRKR